jgi:hypothetical protein
MVCAGRRGAGITFATVLADGDSLEGPSTTEIATH